MTNWLDFLSEGAFLVQGIQAIPPRYFVRKLGVLSTEQLQQVSDALLRWLGLSCSGPHNPAVKEIHARQFENFTLADFDRIRHKHQRSEEMARLTQPDLV